MIVVMNLSGVFDPDSNKLENAAVLDALMTCLIKTNIAYLEHHKAPMLYASRVIYKRTREWERIPDVLARGYGDCKSLAAWRVAEMLVKEGTKAKAVFRFNPRPSSGVPDYHILVQSSKGWEDPSKRLGMNLNENAYFHGAYQR
jgi:hypothetical protein